MTDESSFEAPQSPVQDEYEAWRRYAEKMERYWLGRWTMAEEALERVPQSDDAGRSFVTSYALVMEQERLWNRRFQLLMLLRHRAGKKPSMRTFRAVSPIQGRVVRLVTDKGAVDYEPSLPIARDESMEFHHDGVWAVVMVAPLVEPKRGRRTLYSVPLIEVKEQSCG